MRWAIVIGVDDYGRDDLRLNAAVADATRFRDWVISPRGGNVAPERVRLLSAPGSPGAGGDGPVPTKDNVVAAINEVLTLSGGGGEALFFYFSGHGITARYANREESAIALPGFDVRHPDASLAVRSLTEFFETTQFRDQFFLIDACRTAPSVHPIEIGRWPIPRRRDPGQPPAQQFILYATSPGRAAEEVGFPFPGEAAGAFTEVLMSALKGDGAAKAWSWERNCYEVRWERLADYVLSRMRERGKPDVAEDRWPMQIPQDAGCRGVADRDRDALLLTVPPGAVERRRLQLKLQADPAYDEAEVSVLDAIGEPVVSALKVAGREHTFVLPPKTYAVRAQTGDRIGRIKAPVDLYEDRTETITLEPGGAAPPSGDGARGGFGAIAIRSQDPLALAEICDEAGRVIDVTMGEAEIEEPAGFYRVRPVGRGTAGTEEFVLLAAGSSAQVDLEAEPPSEPVRRLVEALGGEVRDDHVVPVEGTEPVAWAQPSTVMAAAVDAALHGQDALAGVGLDPPGAALGVAREGVALLAVAGDGDPAVLEGLRVRIWRAGDGVPERATALVPTRAGVAAVTVAATEPDPHWLSIEPDDAEPTVVALPMLAGRLATVVAQADPDRVRLYQFHPRVAPQGPSGPGRLRHAEQLQRLLLHGRLDGAARLAQALADSATDDPFAGCVAGYVLLRLGCFDEVRDVALRLADAAPRLSDAYVLRGECEAAKGDAEASRQAFTDAVNTGIPAFGEGLTRLVEGLRANAFAHPRGALVRHIFQRHARGSMWAAFTPRRPLQPGRLVISGADLGFEG